jgi:hypothetical protein
MAGKKEPGVGWRQTPVLVRADIFLLAHEQGIDISDTCNRALADILGIDYQQQQIGNEPVPPPVIIAKDGGIPLLAGAAPAPRKSLMPPVINADDPAAAGTIARIKTQSIRKPANVIPSPVHEEESAAKRAKAPVVTSGKKPPKTAPKKAGKEDGIKKFIATKIIREDADDAIIGKDEFYQIFSRWCREQKISPVPEERTIAIALKNKFAFREKVVEAKSCWVNLRVR